MKLILIFCLAGLPSILFQSCKSKEKLYQVKIDSEIEGAILSYIVENKVDTKSKIITTRWVVTPNSRTDIYISNLNSDYFNNPTSTPTYYSVLRDSVVVFVYDNSEHLIERNVYGVLDEIRGIIKKHGIILERDSGFFYNAPKWRFSKCGNGKGSISKTSHPLDYNFIPCGYILRQDTVARDSLYLIKIKQ